MKARATYSVKRWEEATYRQISPEMKMTRASVEFAFTGDMEGRGSVEYLMFYRHADEKDPHKSAATYVGLIHFEGTVAGKSGTFVMEDHGSFENGTAVSALRVAADSGTGALAGITGTGTYRANQGGFHFELEYNS